MKRIGLILIAILLMTSPMFSQTVSIPDTAFLYALIEEGVDTNEDSLISYAEAEAVSYYLVLYSSNISSVTGIEAFVNLDSLNCVENLLTSLDVSENTALTYLNCTDNQLSSMDVSNNTALSYLYCGENQLISLDVSNCTALTYLSCGWNELTSLNASNCTALTELICHSNQLTSLDVSNCTALTDLFCHANQLSSLDVSNNTALTDLFCHVNQLTSLDVSNNTALRCFCCSDNQLTSLDVSNNTALNHFDCGYNLLTSLNISNNVAISSNGCWVNALNIDGMPSLYEVCVWETFSLGSVEVDATKSPNVYFTTECTVGIKEGRASELSIYPNPTNNLLTIETAQSGKYSIEITSLNGQLIIDGEMEGTTHQIDLSSFQKGAYFITIRSKDFVTTKKIIKL
jgi:hypothetical protein